MAITHHDRSVSELLSDALHQGSALIRSEIRLARAELSAKASRAAIGIGLLAGSAAVIIAALVLILMAVAAGLAAIGLAAGLAYLVSGILGALVSGGLAWAGLGRLTPDELAPNRTIEQLQRDAIAAKEHAQ